MKNYAPGTIVPVGTKVVRTKDADWMIEVWAVYTVSDYDKWFILLEWLENTWHWNIEYFAPYEEEYELEDTATLPVYLTLKEMLYISKGSVIVQRTDWTVVHQADSNYSNNPWNYVIDNLNWLLKEHPEDFKKIN